MTDARKGLSREELRELVPIPEDDEPVTRLCYGCGGPLGEAPIPCIGRLCATCRTRSPEWLRQPWTP